MTVEAEDFLAHYGIKGMRWGRKNASGTVDTGSSSGSGSGQSEGGEKKRLSPETKRKLAIGAGIVGAAAVIAVGAYAANKQIDANKLKTLGEMRKQVETRRAGEAVAKKQLQTYNQKANWKPSTYSKSNREGKRAAAAEVGKYNAQRAERQKAFAERTSANRAAQAKKQRQINAFTPGGRAKNRAADLEVTRREIDRLAKRSKWEMAATPSAKPRPKSTPNYSSRDARKDAKLYGDKGQARIQKNLDKGMNLSAARQKEAVRQNGIKAAQIAMNINAAQRRESKDYDRLRRNR